MEHLESKSSCLGPEKHLRSSLTILPTSNTGYSVRYSICNFAVSTNLGNMLPNHYVLLLLFFFSFTIFLIMTEEECVFPTHILPFHIQWPPYIWFLVSLWYFSHITDQSVWEGKTGKNKLCSDVPTSRGHALPITGSHVVSYTVADGLHVGVG